MTGFISSGNGDLSTIFLRETELLERYIGDQLWLCGAGAAGQLGNNATSAVSNLIQTVASDQNWKEVSVGGGSSSNQGLTTAIKTDGTLWTWGRNDQGQLGNGVDVSDRSSPVQTICSGTNWKQVSAGYYYIAAIKTDGTLWTFGLNFFGQLGDNTITPRSSPVQTVAGGTNWKQVSSKTSHTAAIKTDGTLWAWGYNLSGQLGNGVDITDRSSPAQTIAGGTNWKQVSCGNDHTVAIKTNGELWAWGFNAQGQLGDNTSTNKSSPVQTIAGGTNWKQVSSGFNHILAIKTDGTLWTCGDNTYGQLGDNSITTYSSPVQTICSGTNWKQVSGGNSHSAAIKTDGTLWTWGRNFSGKLGDNTTTDRSSPVQTIAGGTNWKQVSVGNQHTAAINNGAFLG